MRLLDFRFLCLPLLALLLLVDHPAQAVHIDPDGRGQVLLFPYYTVNAGKVTLLTVVNTRSSTKALRVRFRESRNGVEVMAFNLYLAPHDVWTAAIAAPAAGPDYALAAAASISTNDSSCTVPRLPLGGSQTFYEVMFSTGPDADAGPDQRSRTREGFVEVIELGRVEDVPGVEPTSAFPAASEILRSARGERAGCDWLHQTWSNSWLREPGRGILSPDGGLTGNAIIVDVPKGSSFSVSATALDGFFVPARDCAPDCRGRSSENLHEVPWLDPVTLASARSADAGVAHAEFHHGAQFQSLRFSGPDAGLKAVSAVLMQRQIDNVFAHSNIGLQARTEWVLTFPTKPLHLARDTPTERLPFRAEYRWSERQPDWPLAQAAGACEPLRADYGDRQGQRVGRVAEGAQFLPPPIPPAPSLCHASQVIVLNDQAGLARAERLHEVLLGDAPSPLLGSAHPLRWDTCRSRVQRNASSELPFFSMCSASPTDLFMEGWMRLELGDPQRNYLFASPTPDSTTGGANLMLGLPVIGFAVTEFTGGIQQGLLANFSTLAEHAGERAPARGFVDPANPGNGWSAAPAR